ncbi:MAG TPA: DUF3593 domain-containing protein [Chloroflexia bacterium]|nr:DUF3593 domain-containing protein [Chloroflexia bacterium]
MADIVMSLSIVPYLLFLYLVYRIRKLDPGLLHKTTMIGFASMLGFVAITIISAIIALKVFNAKTLGHVDFLHGIAEAGLTLANGLIALGLKKQLDEIELAELDPDQEDTPALSLVGSAPSDS